MKLLLIAVESICVHGRNSGDEALMPLPVLLKGIPQDSTENSTTEYKKGYVVFGYEAVGSGYGGIDNSQDGQLLGCMVMQSKRHMGFCPWPTT